MSEKKRKSTRNFNIEKPVARHFNLEKDDAVGDAPVVASAVSAAQGGSPSQATSPKTPNQGGVAPVNAPAPPATHGSAPQQNPSSPKAPNNGDGANRGTSRPSGGYKKWLYGAAGLLVAGGIAYLLLGKDTGTSSGQSSTQESAQVDTTSCIAEATDSIQANTLVAGENSAADAQSNTDAAADHNAIQKSASQGAGENTTPSAGNNDHASASVERANENSAVPTASVSNDNTAGSGTVEEEALKVISGVYGNNPERRRVLGDKYEAIQKRVNDLYRKGLVR